LIKKTVTRIPKGEGREGGSNNNNKEEKNILKSPTEEKEGKKIINLNHQVKKDKIISRNRPLKHPGRERKAKQITSNNEKKKREWQKEEEVKTISIHKNLKKGCPPIV